MSFQERINALEKRIEDFEQNKKKKHIFQECFALLIFYFIDDPYVFFSKIDNVLFKFYQTQDRDILKNLSFPTLKLNPINILILRELYGYNEIYSHLYSIDEQKECIREMKKLIFSYNIEEQNAIIEMIECLEKHELINKINFFSQ